jgi:hypothetical protein
MARSDALPLSGAASFVAPLEPRRNSYTSPLLPPGLRLVKRGCFATRALPISNRFMVDVDYAAANASAWRSIIAFENRSLSLSEAEFALHSRALPHALAALRAQRVRHTSSMQPRIYPLIHRRNGRGVPQYLEVRCSATVDQARPIVAIRA